MRLSHLFVMFGLLVLFGCTNQGTDNLYDYKGVTVAKDSIPEKCLGKEDCEMFSCMVSQCWCADIPPDNGILFKSGKKITSDQVAKEAVSSYLGYIPQKIYVKKLNAIFYNVFYEVDGAEKVLTIAVDGTIMQTICGV